MSMYYFLSLAILALRCEASLFSKNLNLTGLVEGDMRIDTDPDSIAARGAVCGTCGRWLQHADGTYRVPYKFDPQANFSAAHLKRFDWSFRYYESVTNLKYVERTDEPGFIYVTRDGGCWSYVGRWGNQQKLSIGFGCETIKVINHEFGHAMGLGHEQSRPDVEEHMIIHWENIMSGAESNFRSQTGQYSIAPQFSAYDAASIMHYGSYDFSNNGRRTISTKDPENNKLIDGRRTEFSICDITEFNLMYKGAKMPPTCVPHQAPTGFEPVPSLKSDADAIFTCLYDNEMAAIPDGGRMCQVVGGGEFPPIPPGILSGDTTVIPTTTAISTTTANPTTIAGQTTVAEPTTIAKTTKRNCRLVK